MTHEEADILDSLIELEAGLTAWEIDFIESIEEYRVLDIKLTDKQSACLEKIGLRLL